MNKYLTKIAETAGISDQLDHPDLLRMGGKGVLYGFAGSGLARVARSALTGAAVRHGGMLPAAAAGLGAVAGVGSSRKNQLREQQVHDIKLQGAEQRNEMHNLRINALQKKAQDLELKDPNQTKKDLANTGVIASLGGLGTLATDKVMPAATKAFPKIRRGALVGGIGVGLGLAADYAGLKAKPLIDKQIDKNQK
jgi:hypothetical protein